MEIEEVPPTPVILEEEEGDESWPEVEVVEVGDAAVVGENVDDYQVRDWAWEDNIW